MEFQIAEAIELIKTLAETENLTTEQALTVFVAEAGLDIEYASMLKAKLYEEYTLQEMASDSLSKALYSVFVKGVEVEDIQEVDTKETQEGTKYKVRVQDKASGSTYVRYATRAKIAELRANPNIASVEMTDHGSSSDEDGQKTAKAKGGGGKDHDGDGKVESSSKEHAGVVHNAIQRAKGGKPDGQDTRKEEVEMGEGIDFKGAKRIDDARAAKKAATYKKSPSSKDRDLMKGKFRPGASDEERKSGHRDIMREKGIIPKKNGKKMFEGSLWDQYKAVREGATIEEARAKTKEEAAERLKKNAEAIKAGKPEDSPYGGHLKKAPKEPWSPEDKKAHAKEDKLKEEHITEADLVDAGRENASQRERKKLDGKGVDNSTRIKLMPKMESVVTNTKSSAYNKLFRETTEAASSLQALAEKKGMDLKKFKKEEEKEEMSSCDDKEETKKESVKLDAAGMPILEYSQNRRNGPKSEDLAPPKDAEGERGWKNPEGKPKRPKGGDRRPNNGGPDLPNEKGTVPNGSGV